MASIPTENLEERLEADCTAELDTALYEAQMKALLLAKAFPDSGDLEEIVSGLHALREKTWLSRPAAA